MNKEKKEEYIEEEERITKEEMNIVEYPLTLISKRIPPGVKTIEYTDWITINGQRRQLKWVVTGSDKFGLPTGEDQDFFIAIMEIWRRNGFKERNIPIGSIYSMLKEMGLPTSKYYYERFKLSLDRFHGLSIYTENAFWDREKQGYIPKIGFHIIEYYELYDRYSRQNATVPIPFGYIVMSEFFHQSVLNGNIKDLNLTLYLKLPNPLSKRLYRYLDKKRHYGRYFSINIYKLAGKLGLAPSRTGRYYPSKLSQLLNPALEVLKKENFLKGWRYRKGKEGPVLSVEFVRPGGGEDPEDPVLEDLVSQIAELTGEEHSRGYYYRIVKELGIEKVRAILSETRQAMLEGKIRTSTARYFTDLAERYRGNKPL